MRVKNNQDFYRALHALEEDPKWFTHVGQESGLDQYIDDGDPQTDVKTVLEDRKRLKKSARCCRLIRKHGVLAASAIRSA